MTHARTEQNTAATPKTLHAYQSNPSLPRRKAAQRVQRTAAYCAFLSHSPQRAQAPLPQHPQAAQTILAGASDIQGLQSLSAAHGPQLRTRRIVSFCSRQAIPWIPLCALLLQQRLNWVVLVLQTARGSRQRAKANKRKPCEFAGGQTQRMDGSGQSGLRHCCLKDCTATQQQETARGLCSSNSNSTGL